MDRSAAPDAWSVLERATALATVALVAARIPLATGVTAGSVLAVALLPLWWSVVVRSRVSMAVFGVGVLAIVNGVVLTFLAAPDRLTDLRYGVETTMVLGGLLLGVGVVLWARRLLPTTPVAVAFGVGLLAGIDRDAAAFAGNPWKYGFAVPFAVLLLVMAGRLAHRGMEAMVAALLTVFAVASDARASAVVLGLTALLVAVQAIPWRVGGGRSAWWRWGVGPVLLLVLAAGAYRVGEQLILAGLFGPETQARSLEQISLSGSLLLGGRPEIGASAALAQFSPAGYGAGTLPSHADVVVAQRGMAALGYDPENGYVERYMFGNGIELHSVAADLWVHFGVAGAVAAVLLLVTVLGGLTELVRRRAASGLLLWLGLWALWNLAFGPLYSAQPLLVLFIGLLIPALGLSEQAAAQRRPHRDTAPAIARRSC